MRSTVTNKGRIYSSHKIKGKHIVLLRESMIQGTNGDENTC
jgi:hypothetical protein